MTEASKVKEASEPGSTSRRPRYVGVTGQAAHPLTPLKLTLLTHIAACGMLSTPQLLGLSGYSAKSAYKHLRDLLDHGLIDIIAVPRAALAPLEAGNDHALLFGSAPNIYTPTKAGLRLLYDMGLIEREAMSAKPLAYGPRNSLFLAHELAVRDVRVWLAQVERTYGNAHTGLMQWHHGTDAEIEMGDYANNDPPRWVRPDAWFVYGLREPGVLVGLVEVDRGTERGQGRWREKFVAYARLFAGERVLALTGQKQARVLVMVPSVSRRETLASWLGEWLAQADVPPDRFWLAEASALSDVASDLRAAVWRVPGRDRLLPLVPERFM